MERIFLLVDDPQVLEELLTPAQRADVVRIDSFDQVKPSDDGTVVLVVDDQRLGADPATRAETIHARLPSVRFVFVNRSKDAERARLLAPLGAVLPLPLDAARLELALRHAFALGAMAAKMQAIRGPGRSPTLDGRAKKE